jgi:polymorphic toxin system nucleotidyltransferase-like protein
VVAARRTLVAVTPVELRDRLSKDPAAAALQLAVLHGSRARGDAAEGSDWVIGVLADDPPDLPALSAALTEILGTGEVDVVDLNRASALLRYCAARDGIPVLERSSGEFQRFQLAAVAFWCDIETVIRSAHNDVLAALG